MILQNIVFRDYETAGKRPSFCQPVQLASVIIDARRLEIVPDSLFESLMRPEFDDAKARDLGFDPVDDQALDICKLTREQLATAPAPNVVWQKYVEYLSNYNTKGKSGGQWDAPIRAGFNNGNFDDTICWRMCWYYGPTPTDNNIPIYHPIDNYDMGQVMKMMFNGHRIHPKNSMSMDALREYMGYSKEGAHNAKVDVLQGADMLIRYLRLNRSLIEGKINLPLGKKIKFKDCVGGKI